MEVRPRKNATTGQGRGSGPGTRRRRSDALGPRKDVIIRMPEETARRLKIAAACEEMTVMDFCMQVIGPHIDKTLNRHGVNFDK